MARRILAMLLLLFATPAFAQTYTGTIDGSTPLDLPIPAGPGLFNLEFWFSKPTPLTIAVSQNVHYNIHELYSGYDYDGDYPIFDYFYFDGPVQHGLISWRIWEPESYSDLSNNYQYSYQGLIASFSFEGDIGTFRLAPSDLSYTVTISSVPEPTQWVLLIGGFGLAGTALRRRRDPAKVALAA